jgi:putative transcriptional regulator
MAKRARTKRIPTMGGDGEGYLAGQILIATPSMQDPQFAGSIICVCAHSEEGAMGLVLNRPMEGLSFDDLLKQLDLEPVPAQRSIRLHQGGPQEGGRGFVLHTNDWSSEGSLQVGGDLALTASVDILKAIASGGGPRLGLLALGYAGWGPGQLEAELERDDWIVAGSVEDDVFDEDASTLWSRVLDRQGGKLRLVARMPLDPSLN